MELWEKHCGWDYLLWWHEPELINSKFVVTPNPLCIWCDYIEACRIWVTLFMNWWIEIDDACLDEIQQTVLDKTAGIAPNSKTTTH